MSQSLVYFVTPSELMAAPVSGKTYRLGGMVRAGTFWEPKSLDLTFAVSDEDSGAVRHKAPPTCLRRARAVVEARGPPTGTSGGHHPGQAFGRVQGAPRRQAEPGYKELMRTLQGSSGR